jgi:hypothetical protein
MLLQVDRTQLINPRKNKMAKDIRQDEDYRFFMREHSDDFMSEVLASGDAERACESFPGDPIRRMLEMLNSNFIGPLLFRYPDDLVGAIADDIDAGKYKITPEQLKKKLKKAKK